MAIHASECTWTWCIQSYPRRWTWIRDHRCNCCQTAFRRWPFYQGCGYFHVYKWSSKQEKIPAVSLHTGCQWKHFPGSRYRRKHEAGSHLFFLTKTPPQLTSWFVMLSCSRLSSVRKSRSLRFWNVQKIFIKSRISTILLPEVQGILSYCRYIQMDNYVPKILQLLSKIMQPISSACCFSYWFSASTAIALWADLPNLLSASYITVVEIIPFGAANLSAWKPESRNE